MDQMTLKIQGMSCGHCVAAVTRALESVEGVEVKDVRIGTATVAFDAGATPAERITEAVEGEGYAVATMG